MTLNLQMLSDSIESISTRASLRGLASSGIVISFQKASMISIVIDNYLSPLSSYPVNGTLQLLFAQPFQRIYEDIYLLDGEAFKLLSSRAAAIFNNFADIVFELIKNDPPEEKILRTMTKQLIFHWNIASTRFDLICYQLAQIYEKDKNANYHLCTEGLNYKIEDLDADSKQLLQEYVGRSILVEGSAPLEFDEFGSTRFIARSMENPFTRLRPCLAFKDMNPRNDFISIEEIMGELESKLTKFIKGNQLDSLDSELQLMRQVALPPLIHLFAESRYRLLSICFPVGYRKMHLRPLQSCSCGSHDGKGANKGRKY